MMDDDDAQEMKFVVDQLNRPPFNMNITLVTLSQKNQMELLQVVNDVFAELDASHKRDVRSEPPEQMQERMLSFTLGTLNYKPVEEVEEFNENFIKGVQDTIIPFLYYVLSEKSSLKKRAYLARYLSSLEVPEEMFADSTIVGLYQKLSALQAEFKEVHKTVDRARLTRQDPAELERHINQLQTEKEQLMNKLSQLRARVKTEFSGVNFKDVLQATHKLRKEQEEEARLYQQTGEQKQRLQRAEQVERQTRAKLQALERSDIAKEDPAKLLSRLRQEVQKNNKILNEKLDKDVKTREKSLRELQHLSTSSPMQQHEVDQLERETADLQRMVDTLTQKRDDSMASADGKIGFFRDRAVAVEKKKEQVLENLTELEEEKKEAEQDIRNVEAELKALMVDGEKPKTDKQMREYMHTLAAKTNQYKQSKAELQASRDEVQVLMRTEELLRSRVDNIEEFNKKLEQERGVVGAAATQANLEDVSAKKGAVDATKGKTLDEISAVVANITQTLKARKNRLAPQIKELRAVRNVFEELEGRYTKKKGQYDALVAGLNTTQIKLKKDVDENIQGLLEEESSYHFLSALTLITQVRLDQMAGERNFLSGSDRLFNNGPASYKEAYEQQIADHDKRGKALRQEKVHVKENHSEFVNQRSMFLSLRNLMKAKEAAQKAEKQQALKNEQQDMLSLGLDDGAQTMTFD